jgi:ABC-type sugar transport system ATPase subunit
MKVEKGIGANCVLGIRPEDMSITTDETANAFEGMSLVSETLGSDDFVSSSPRNKPKGEIVTVRIEPEIIFPLDTNVYIAGTTAKMHLFAR